MSLIMNDTLISKLFLESIKITMMLSIPLLLSVLCIGLVMNILQSVTQIHEQTLSFIPKLISIIIVFILCKSWMTRVMVDYMVHILKSIPYLVLYHVYST